ncbi:MAG: hypothetical protein ACRCSN_17890 [Dermatophilaceae bacterium]
MTRRRGFLHTGAALAVAAAVAMQMSAAAAPVEPSPRQLTEGQRDALAAGLQIAPKKTDVATKMAVAEPNPFVANVEDLTSVDMAAWRLRMKNGAKERAGSADYRSIRAAEQASTAAADAPVVWDEKEPAGTAGSNDALSKAEPVDIFGTAAGKSSVVRIVGEQAVIAPPAPSELAPVAEDNGAIPLAGDTGIAGSGAVTTSGVLGDGPHGPDGTGTNDFDFYKLDVSPGFTVVADTSGSAQGTDTSIGLYAADGTLVAADDDSGDGLAGRITTRTEAGGIHYVVVGGFSSAGALPKDPNDPASGNGGADTGDYLLSVTSTQVDSDDYAVQLRPGDVVGGVGSDAADTLTVFRPDGTQMVSGARTDPSVLYPPESPLPGGGNTSIAYVAEEAGWYVLRVGGADGDYQVQLEGYRPGAETDRRRTQTVYLDFEGGRVNTNIWGGPGVRELSPFSTFLAAWGISPDREQAMIDAITAQVRDNIVTEVTEDGLNPNLRVRVVNSRTNPGLAGRENVSRVIVGGTIAESGISTIGVAQFIDPGNWGHEDSALILLDTLSEPAGSEASLNTYLTDASDRERFVAQAVGNATAHEIGHTVGNYHTDNLNEQVNLMDAGGAGLQNLYGVGADGVGGTADDLDVAFEEDQYLPSEGYTGLEDTQNVTGWAYPSR